MATIVAAAAGGNWTSTATWVGGVVPTATDDVQLTSSSGNVTINSNTSVANSLDCTGYTGTLTHNGSITLTLGSSGTVPSNVVLKFVSGMTYSIGNSSSTFAFASTNATTQTFDTSAKMMGSLSFTGLGGSWKPTSSVSMSGTMTLSGGTFDADVYAISMGGFSSSNTAVRTLKLGNNSWTISNAGTAWNMGTSTNATINSTGASISFTNTSSSLKTLAFGSKAYGSTALYISGAGTGNYLIQGNNSFSELHVLPGISMSLQTGNTLTVTTQSGVYIQGTSSQPITIGNSTQSGSISMANGTVIADWLILQYSNVKGGASWYAGLDSIDNGNNTGWIFNIAAISVNDMIVTSENTQIVVSDPIVNVSDAITTSENTQGYIAWNFSDKLFISENIVLQIPEIFLNVSDAITTSELSTVIRPILEISLSESITTSESIGILAATDTPKVVLQEYIQTIDGYIPTFNALGNVYLGDTNPWPRRVVAHQIITVLVINVSDTTTLSEHLDVGSLSGQTSDSMTVTESLSYPSELVATRELVIIQIQQFTTTQQDSLVISENLQVFTARSYISIIDLVVIIPEPIELTVVIDL